MTQSPPQPPPQSTPPTPGPAQRGPERFAAPVAQPQRASWPQALGAGLALVFLLVGVPVLLWTLTGAPPFPDGVPGRDELTQPLSVDALFAVLRAVVWLAWLQFTICTVVEVLAIVRGGGLPRPVPLSGPAQGLARALVGTVLIGSSLFATSAAATAADTPSGPAGQGAVAVAVQGTMDNQVGEAVGASVAGTAAQERAEARQVPGVPSTMSDVLGRRVVVVQPPDGHHHDNLWDIAERHLGDGRRWNEIYDLNKGRQQPDGQELVIGRLIQPGWVLIMPDDARDAPRVEVAPQQSSAQQDRAGGDERAVGTGRAADDVADAVGGADLVESETGSGAAPFVGGGLLAAMLAGLLLAERRRRRGPDPTDADLEAEVVLRAGADHDRVERIDRALRSLSAHCRAERVPLPQVYAASVDDVGIELRIAPPVPVAPAPWAAVDGGAVWRLDRSSDLPEGSGHAPYPGLVCLGRTDEGADVLVDLEAVGGVLALSGSHTVAREIVSALAVQLATVPWADAQVVHGFDLSPHLGPVAGDVLRRVDDLDAFVGEWADSAPGKPAQEVLGGRLGRRPGVQPHYLLLGSVPADDERRAAVGALGAGGTRGVGVVSAVPVPGSRWRVHVDDTGRLTIPLLDLDVRAVRLTESVAATLGELFARVRASAPVVAGSRPSVPEPPRPGADTEWRLAEVSVGVLGAVTVRAGGSIDPSRLELATEIVTFLALQNGPVHPSVVGASVWPRGVTPEVRDATIQRVREWLGTIDDVHALGMTSEGRLFLADQVAVDWHALCALLRRARDVNPDDERDLLRRALRLVRGTPLEGRPATRYSWLPRTRLELQSVEVVVDAAHRLAVLSFDDDPGGAAAACRSGLRLAPHSQVLWRDLLLAESLHPDGPGSAAAVEEMMTVLHDLGVPPDAETEALVEELLPGGQAPAAG